MNFLRKKVNEKKRDNASIRFPVQKLRHNGEGEDHFSELAQEVESSSRQKDLSTQGQSWTDSTYDFVGRFRVCSGTSCCCLSLGNG